MIYSERYPMINRVLRKRLGAKREDLQVIPSMASKSPGTCVSRESDIRSFPVRMRNPSPNRRLRYQVLALPVLHGLGVSPVTDLGQIRPGSPRTRIPCAYTKKLHRQHSHGRNIASLVAGAIRTKKISRRLCDVGTLAERGLAFPPHQSILPATVSPDRLTSK